MVRTLADKKKQMKHLLIGPSGRGIEFPEVKTALGFLAGMAISAASPVALAKPQVGSATAVPSEELNAAKPVAPSFSENRQIWAQIDDLNAELRGYHQNAADHRLAKFFSRTLEILKSEVLERDLEQIWDLDETNREWYQERAEPAIKVMFMGESTNTGVNIEWFLMHSEFDSEDMRFFSLAKDGFYRGENGLIGTAEFPLWMERAESSFQARVVPHLAKEYLRKWETLKPQLHGAYLKSATETISTLRREIAEPR